VLKFLLVVLVFAAMVYAIMWAVERRRVGGSTNGSTSSPPAPRRQPRPQVRQVAPDDDEDFLRWLERQRRKDSPEQ